MSILVRSSHGIFFFDSYEGAVVDIDLTEEFGDLPVRVDVDDLRKQPVPKRFEKYLRNGLMPEYDVLDVGYWTEDGTYVPPEEEWRLERDQNVFISDMSSGFSIVKGEPS
jgi:hypothetical protein